MPALSLILKTLTIPVFRAIAPYLKPLMNSAMPVLSKMLKSTAFRIGLLGLILLAAGFLTGYLWKDSKPPETITVERTVPVTEIVEVMPAIPECAAFKFDPDIGGMAGDQLVILTARLYQWGSGCSSALKRASR